MPSDDVKQLCKEERGFLHDIATPIGTVFFLVDALLESQKASATPISGDVEQLEIARQSLEKIKDLLQKRRETLIKRGE